MDILIKEYLEKDKTADHFRLAISAALKSFNEDTLQKTMNRLRISLSEICYINNAEAIKEVDLLWNKNDYGLQLGIGVEVKTNGKLKESLGRLLIFLKRKMAETRSDLVAQSTKVNDLRSDISMLMRDEAKIIDCPICEGTGKTMGYDDEEGVCWNCEGDKKIIQEITK